MNPSRGLPPSSDRVVAWLVRRRWIVLTAAVLLGGLSAWRTAATYAALRSDLEELLPAIRRSTEAG